MERSAQRTDRRGTRRAELAGVPGGARLLFAALIAASCHAADKAPRATTDSAAAPAPRDTSVPAPPAPSWTRIAWEPNADAKGTADYGTGVISIALRGDATGAPPSTDTLIFREQPDSLSRPVGALLVEHPKPGERQYAALAPAGLRPNFLEYAPNEFGVPIDSTDVTRAWVRGLIGSDPAGFLLHGWTRLEAKRLVMLEWPQYLPSRHLTFRDTSRALLYATHADAEANRNGIKLPARRYTMEGIAAEGPWLRVKFQWPFDACQDGDMVQHTTREFWIRYLDARGRPLVFYPMKTC